MRPVFHLTAPRHWINDPNGFIHYRGRYHLFYQHFPYANRWGTMHWGHAVSDDLVRWRDRPIALVPTVRHDENGCFSGSALEKDGALHLYYTGVRYLLGTDAGNVHLSLDGRIEQRQLHLNSPDGESFDCFTGKQTIIDLLDPATLGAGASARDPKVWAQDGRYYLILGSQYLDGDGAWRPQLPVFVSDDAHVWRPLARNARPGIGSMYECPDLFDVDGHTALVLCAMDYNLTGKGPREIALCGGAAFDPQTGEVVFDAAAMRPLDGGDLYATQTSLDARGRRTLVGWVRQPASPDGERIGMICAPRVAHMRDGRLCFDIHPNVRAAFSAPVAMENAAADGPLCIRATLGEGDWLDIGGYSLRLRGGVLTADRSAVFVEGYPGYAMACVVQTGGRCALEIYLDHGVAEVFINGGEHTITHAVYGMGRAIATNTPGAVQCFGM